MPVRLAPAEIVVAAGQTVDAAIEVVAAPDLYGIDVSLTFDPNVVEVVDADPSTEGVQVALGTFLDPGFVIRNAADNTAGTVRFAMTQLSPSEPKSGSGVVVVVKLRGKQAGVTSPLTIVKAGAAQRTGESIPTLPSSGQVRVVAVAGQAPTATSIPTQAVSTLAPAPTEPVSTASAATATPVATAANAAAATTAPTATPAVTQAPAATAVQATLAPVVTGAEASPAPLATGDVQAAAAPAASPVAAVESTPIAGETAVAAAQEATTAPVQPATVVAGATDAAGTTVAATVVAAAPAGGIPAKPVQDIPAPADDAANEQSSGMGSLLLFGGGALILAAVVLAAFVLLRQRSGRTP